MVTKGDPYGIERTLSDDVPQVFAGEESVPERTSLERARTQSREEHARKIAKTSWRHKRLRNRRMKDDPVGDEPNQAYQELMEREAREAEAPSVPMLEDRKAQLRKMYGRDEERINQILFTEYGESGTPAFERYSEELDAALMEDRFAQFKDKGEPRTPDESLIGKTIAQQQTDETVPPEAFDDLGGLLDDPDPRSKDEFGSLSHFRMTPAIQKMQREEIARFDQVIKDREMAGRFAGGGSYPGAMPPISLGGQPIQLYEIRENIDHALQLAFFNANLSPGSSLLTLTQRGFRAGATGKYNQSKEIAESLSLIQQLQKAKNDIDDDPGAFSTYINEVADPFAGIMTAWVQQRIPGQQEVQVRYEEYLRRGLPRKEAATRAYQEWENSPIKLLTDIGFDPLNLVPIIGFPGALARAAARGVLTTAAVVAIAGLIGKGVSKKVIQDAAPKVLRTLGAAVRDVEGARLTARTALAPADTTVQESPFARRFLENNKKKKADRLKRKELEEGVQTEPGETPAPRDAAADQADDPTLNPIQRTSKTRRSNDFARSMKQALIVNDDLLDMGVDQSAFWTTRQIDPAIATDFDPKLGGQDWQKSQWFSQDNIPNPYDAGSKETLDVLTRTVAQGMKAGKKEGLWDRVSLMSVPETFNLFEDVVSTLGTKHLDPINGTSLTEGTTAFDFIEEVRQQTESALIETMMRPGGAAAQLTKQGMPSDARFEKVRQEARLITEGMFGKAMPPTQEILHLRSARGNVYRYQITDDRQLIPVKGSPEAAFSRAEKYEIFQEGGWADEGMDFEEFLERDSALGPFGDWTRAGEVGELGHDIGERTRIQAAFRHGIKDTYLDAPTGKTALQDMLKIKRDEGLLSEDSYNVAADFIERIDPDIMEDLSVSLIDPGAPVLRIDEDLIEGVTRFNDPDMDLGVDPLRRGLQYTGRFKETPAFDFPDTQAGLFRSRDAFEDHPLITIALTAMSDTNSKMTGRTIVHELAHYFEQYFPEKWLKALNKEFLDDVKKNAPGALRRISVADELLEIGMITPIQRARIDHEAYRYTNFSEWFAESMADAQLLSYVRRNTKNSTSRMALTYLEDMMRRIYAYTYNFMVKRGINLPTTTRFLDELTSGMIGKETKRPYIYQLDKSILDASLLNETARKRKVLEDAYIERMDVRRRPSDEMLGEKEWNLARFEKGLDKYEEHSKTIFAQNMGKAGDEQLAESLEALYRIRAEAKAEAMFDLQSMERSFREIIAEPGMQIRASARLTPTGEARSAKDVQRARFAQQIFKENPGLSREEAMQRASRLQEEGKVPGRGATELSARELQEAQARDAANVMIEDEPVASKFFMGLADKTIEDVISSSRSFARRMRRQPGGAVRRRPKGKPYDPSVSDKTAYALAAKETAEQATDAADAAVKRRAQKPSRYKTEGRLKPPAEKLGKKAQRKANREREIEKQKAASRLRKEQASAEARQKLQIQMLSELDPMVTPKSGIRRSDYDPSEVRFAPEIEKVLSTLKEMGMEQDRTLWDHAFTDLGQPSLVGRLSRKLSPMRLVDTMKNRSDMEQAAFISASREYRSEQTLVQAKIGMIGMMLSEAFGTPGSARASRRAMQGMRVNHPGVRYKTIVNGKIKLRELDTDEAYIFPDYVEDETIAPYVGTIFDIMSRRDRYVLTKLQDRAIKQISKVLNEDLLKTIDSGASYQGMTRPKLNDTYIPYKVKNPSVDKTYSQKFGGRPLAASERLRSSKTVQEFYQKVFRMPRRNGKKQQVETSIERLMLKRMGDHVDIRTRGGLAAKLMKQINPTQDPNVPGRLVGHIVGGKRKLLKGIYHKRYASATDNEIPVPVGTKIYGVPADKINMFDDFMTGAVGMRRTIVDVTGRKPRTIIDPKTGEEALQTPAQQVQDLPREFMSDRDSSTDWVDQFKGMMLNVDVSVAGGRQGLLLFARDPNAWVKSQRDFWRMADRPEHSAMFLLENLEGMVQAQRAGLQLSQTAEGLQFSIPGLVTKMEDLKSFNDDAIQRKTNKLWIESLPGLGHVNERQFQAILMKGKYLVYRGALSNLHMLRDGGTVVNNVLENFPILGDLGVRWASRRMRGANLSDFELQQVAADWANNYLGGIEWARISAQPLSMPRRLVLLTEGWTRARMGNIINLPKMSPAGILARRAFMQEVVIMNMIGSLVNMARVGVRDVVLPGEFYDPTSSEFNTVMVGDRRIRLTPHAAEWRTIAKVLMGTPDDDFRRALLLGEYDVIPDDSTPVPDNIAKMFRLPKGELSWSEVYRRSNYALQFAEDRQGQFLSIGQDILMNETRMGLPVRTSDGLTGIAEVMGYVAESVVPLAFSGMVSEARRASGIHPLGRETEILDEAWALGFDIPGLSSWEPGLSEKMAQYAGVEDWHEGLSPAQKDKILMSKDGMAIYMRKATNPKARERMQERWTFFQEQQERDKWVNQGWKPTGRGKKVEYRPKDWANDTQSEKIQLYARVDILTDADDMDNYVPTTEEQELLRDWYNLKDAADFDYSEGGFDAVLWEQAQEQFLKDLNPEQRAYVETNTVRYATPKQKRYAYANRVLIRQWEDVGSNAELWAFQHGYGREAAHAYRQKLERRSLSFAGAANYNDELEEQVREMWRSRREEQNRLRVNNPDIDYALVYWREMKPVMEGISDAGQSALWIQTYYEGTQEKRGEKSVL